MLVNNETGIVQPLAAVREREATVARATQMRDRLASSIRASAPEVVVTAASAPRCAATLHLQIKGVESEALLIALDDLGVCASAGSACASGALEPSHVLAAMGVPVELSRGALRLSLGWSTTDADIHAAALAVPKAIEMLRANQ
jgi:cysteine desulfurase